MTTSFPDTVECRSMSLLASSHALHTNLYRPNICLFFLLNIIPHSLLQSKMADSPAEICAIKINPLDLISHLEAYLSSRFFRQTLNSNQTNRLNQLPNEILQMIENILRKSLLGETREKWRHYLDCAQIKYVGDHYDHPLQAHHIESAHMRTRPGDGSEIMLQARDPKIAMHQGFVRECEHEMCLWVEYAPESTSLPKTF